MAPEEVKLFTNNSTTFHLKSFIEFTTGENAMEYNFNVYCVKYCSTNSPVVWENIEIIETKKLAQLSK